MAQRAQKLTPKLLKTHRIRSDGNIDLIGTLTGCTRQIKACDHTVHKWWLKLNSRGASILINLFVAKIAQSFKSLL